MSAHRTHHSDSGYVAINLAPQSCGSQSYFNRHIITKTGLSDGKDARPAKTTGFDARVAPGRMDASVYGVAVVAGPRLPAVAYVEARPSAGSVVGEITPPGQHHYPAEPDSVRSAAFPHMFVTGNTRDMLFADVALMRKLQNAVDDDLEDALENWSQHHTTRARQYVHEQITRVRLLRGARLNAWRRLIDGRSARSVA